MCNPAIAVAAAGAGLSIMGQKSQQKATERMSADEQRQLNYEALVEEDQAAADAREIRSMGQSYRGQTLAGAAASGVKIGEGSALDAERRVMEDTELDAASAILTGARRARALRAGGIRAANVGRDARNAFASQAAGSLISFGAKAFGGGGFGG